MPTVVPESVWVHGQEALAAALAEALDALLEFTGATAGWVGLTGPDGRLSFPAARGRCSPGWLALQQGQGVWGFEVREGPTLLNDLPAVPALGEPPLTSLLSCPLFCRGSLRGHVVLANKPSGFTSHDCSVLLGMAHLMGKWLGPEPGRAPLAALAATAPLLRQALDRVAEGVLVVDGSGMLVFANATWSSWTGFRPEELINRPAPFPFWISQRELPALGKPAVAAAPGEVPDAPRLLGVFPFRHRSDTIFWCQVATTVEEVEGRPLTFAFLRRMAAAAPELAAKPPEVRYSFLDLAKNLPFALALTDRHGKVLWVNEVFDRTVAPAATAPGQPLRLCFAPRSAAVLERLFRAADPALLGPVGRLALERRADIEGERELMAFWLALDLPDGPGFLFAFNEDWEALCPPADLATGWQQALRPTILPGLPLLIQPGGEVRFWDERWQALTGLTAADLAGVPSEVVLDWLFPRQPDRDRVADLLHQPLAPGSRRGCQMVLDVLTRNGSRPLLCTFLPVPTPEGENWLLLAGAPEALAGEDSPAMALVRQFARGLSHLLDHRLAEPLGLAEQALDRADLAPEAAALFEQIAESCRRSAALVGLLQDLGAPAPGDLELTSLAGLVREFLDEEAAVAGERDYELSVDLRDADALVRVNRRMLKVVLRELLANAEQALVNSPRRRVTVRVVAREDTVCCEIEDTGEGLPIEDWPRVLVPFYSTKGPFARDAAHAALEATGLGLTVSQHLLALHGGRLELRGRPGEGTTAVIVLPRGLPTTEGGAPAHVETKLVRADIPGEAHEPHAPAGLTSALDKPPGSDK
ncbi:MAG TPA: ATP-binding protein [Gemmataceae bacterium]|nr:ATP-binding protein [Gemmataceae bacterium]